MAVYPAILPPPKKSGYGIKPKSGVIKTEMTSGPARQRRITARPPTDIRVVWSFTQEELGVFEAWYLHKAKMGAEWFYISLLSGLGLVTHKARFTDESYEAKPNPETNKFDVSATLETQVRPVLSPGALDLTLIYGIQDINNAASRLKTCVHNAFIKI